MAKTVEPPILMSRILAFVLSASVVVLGTLVFTLSKMAPLERPEVFFLVTPTRLANVIIRPFAPDTTNKTAVQHYINGFIREYIIARNTLSPNANVSRTNWAQVVMPWSSENVFNDLKNTSLYKRYTFDYQAPNISCDVNFSNSDQTVLAMGNGSYQVKFTWVCKNINGQTTTKNYKIQIRIQSNLGTKTSETADNLAKLRINPLGIQVIQYIVLDNKSDPLDSDMDFIER